MSQIAGQLEIQIFAGLARLQKDMNDAKRMVGGAMGNIESAVNRAKSVLSSFGMGLGVAVLSRQLVHLSDNYTKLTAQIRISTQTSEEYAQSLDDIRRISSKSQADINATSMLYTRLMNVMRGTNVTQKEVAQISETVSLGLKAFGATAQEAYSGALQLSQAFGANRLGGEEFRAVMEAMPNVMRLLADSMGVPLGALRQLSIDGKITAAVMAKAWANPEVIAKLQQQVIATRTISGAFVELKNEATLMVGELSKTSGAYSGMQGTIIALVDVLKILSKYMNEIIALTAIYAALLVGKYTFAMASSLISTIKLAMAQKEALAMNVAWEKSRIVSIKSIMASTEMTIANTVAETQNALAKKAVAIAEQQEIIVQLEHVKSTALLSGNMIIARQVEAELVITRQAVNVATAESIVLQSKLTALEEAQIIAQRSLAASNVSLAAAEKARATAAVSAITKLNELGMLTIAIWTGLELGKIIEGPVNRLIDSIPSLRRAIDDALNPFFDLFTNFGKDIGQTIVDGMLLSIKSAIPAIAPAISRLSNVLNNSRKAEAAALQAQMEADAKAASAMSKRYAPAPVPSILVGGKITDTAGGYGLGIERMQQFQKEELKLIEELIKRREESAEKRANEIKKLADLQRQFADDADSDIKRQLADEAQVKASNESAIDALAREVVGWSKMSKVQQTSWDILVGRYKDFDEQTQNELLRLAELIDKNKERVDAEKKFADEEKIRMAEQREREDNLLDEMIKRNKEMDQYAKTAAKHIQSAFADFLFDPFKAGLGGMLDGFTTMLRRMAAEAAAAQIARSIFGSFAEGGSGDGFLGGFLKKGLDFLGLGGASSGGSGGTSFDMFKDLIPSYDVGTNYVPRTGLALVHQGEKITPASENTSKSVTVINNFTLATPTDKRTQQQISTMTGLSVQRAMLRGA